MVFTPCLIQRGEEYLVSLCYNDFPTHEGLYAIDWLMPENTILLAARDGVVVRIIDSFSESGLTPEFKSRSNLSVLRHADGSFTEYNHLVKKGVKVKIGQILNRCIIPPTVNRKTRREIVRSDLVRISFLEWENAQEFLFASATLAQTVNIV